MSAPPTTLWTFLMRQAATGPLGDFLDGPYALRPMRPAMQALDDEIRRDAERAARAAAAAASSPCTQPASSTPARAAPHYRPASHMAAQRKPRRARKPTQIATRDQ